MDLSHTQNIGNMLRTHFSNSQFIVVSLKEGMFNNANVIFRTKASHARARFGFVLFAPDSLRSPAIVRQFVEGVSTVSRTVTARNARAQDDAENHGATPNPRSKKRGKKAAAACGAAAPAEVEA